MEERLINKEVMRPLCNNETFPGFLIEVEGGMSKSRVECINDAIADLRIAGGGNVGRWIDDIYGKDDTTYIYVPHNWGTSLGQHCIPHAASIVDAYPRVFIFIPRWRRTRWKND